LLAGCSHHQAKVNVPPPPSIQTPPAQEEEPQAATTPEERTPDRENSRNSKNAKPLMVETGLASWYGPPYNHHRGSNGEIFDMNAMTAAHLTLPLGSVVRVTNVKTEQSATVRITDRGPFVDGRIIDLSLAAAKKSGVYLPGVAMVRLEVLETPTPLASGGRWAVQIGGFEKEGEAEKLANHLSRRYQTAKVLCFKSVINIWWVRVRVQDDERERAEEVAHDTHSSEGSIFLVRLD
jgi:rare lipoprotein A